MLLTMETEIKHDFNFSQQVTGDVTAAGGSNCFVYNCGLEVKINLGRSQSNCNYVAKYNKKDNIRKNNVPFVSIVQFMAFSFARRNAENDGTKAPSCGTKLKTTHFVNTIYLSKLRSQRW